MAGPAKQEQEQLAAAVDLNRLTSGDGLYPGEDFYFNPEIAGNIPPLIPSATVEQLFPGRIVVICASPIEGVVVQPENQGETIGNTKSAGLAEHSFEHDQITSEEEKLFSTAEQFFLEKIGLKAHEIRVETKPIKARVGNRGILKTVGYRPVGLSATFYDWETDEFFNSDRVSISELNEWQEARSPLQREWESRNNPRYQAAYAAVEDINHLPILRQRKENREFEVDWEALLEEIANLKPEEISEEIVNRWRNALSLFESQSPKERKPNSRILIPIGLLVLATIACVQAGKWDANSPPFQSTPTAVFSADNGNTADSGQGAAATPFLYPTYPSNEPEYCEKDPIILPDDPQALLGVHFNEYGPFTVITPGDNMKDILRKFGEVFGRKGFWNSVEQLINQYIRSIVDKEDETESSGAKILWLIPRDQDIARIKSQSDQKVAAIHFVPNSTSYMTFDVDSSGEVIPAIAVMHNKYFDQNMLRTVPGGEQLWEMLVIMGEAAKENRAYQRNAVIIHPQYREQVTGREEFRTRKAYSVRNVFGDSLPQNELLEADSPMTPVFAPDFIEIEDVLTGTHFSDCYFGPAETISMVPTGTVVNIDAIAWGRDYQQGPNKDGVYPARLYARVSFTGIGENLSNRPFFGDKTKDAYYELMQRKARQFWVPLDHLAIPDPNYNIGS